MDKENSLKIYWKLFLTNLILSSCTFGGGFVIITMMKRKFVEELHWIEENEMLDMTAIAQSSPGSLAINMAIIIGYRLKKILGAFVSVLGTVIPPLIIISAIALIYNWFKTNTQIVLLLQVMRAGVAAVIFDVVISLAYNIFKTKNVIWISVMFITFILSFFFNVGAIIIIIACAIIGLLVMIFSRK